MQRFRLRRAIGGAAAVCLFAFLGLPDLPAARGDTPLSRILTSDVTNATFSDDLLKLWHRDIEHYRKLTKDPEELRDRGEKLILTVQEALLPYPRGPGFKAAIFMARDLWKDGSRDPLVRAYFAIARSEEYPDPHWSKLKRVEIAWPYLKTLRDSQYPQECQVLLGIKLFEYATPYIDSTSLAGDTSGPKLCTEIAKLMTERISDDTIDPELQRCLYFELQNLLTPPQGATALLRTCETRPHIDPWLLQMIRGAANWQTAAQQGEKSGVNWRVAKGAAKAGGNVQKASDAYRAAYQLHPDYPEAAAWMIELAARGADALTPRQWFERAVNAQFDYMPAYQRMQDTLRPLRDGSLKAVYAFGCECADSKRYDTAVPTQLFDALATFDGWFNDGRYWNERGVYERINTMFTKVAEDPSRADGEKRGWTKNGALTALASLAAFTEHYDDARQILDVLGPDVTDEWTTSVYRYDPRLPIIETYAATGRGGDDVKQALALYRAKEVGEHSDELVKKIGKLFVAAYKAEDEERSREYCQMWIDLLKDRLAFSRGEWVNKQIGKTQRGWKAFRGSWTFNGEEAIGIPGDHDWGLGSVMPDLIVNGPLEIEFDLGVDEPSKSQFLGAGLRVEDRRNEYLKADANVLLTVSASLRDGNCRMGVAHVEFQPKRIKLNDMNHYYVQLADHHVVAYINGELVADRNGIDFLPRYHHLEIGCLNWVSTLHTIHVRNVRYRRWDGKRPAEPRETAGANRDQPQDKPATSEVQGH